MDWDERPGMSEVTALVSASRELTRGRNAVDQFQMCRFSASCYESVGSDWVRSQAEDKTTDRHISGTSDPECNCNTTKVTLVKKDNARMKELQRTVALLASR